MVTHSDLFESMLQIASEQFSDAETISKVRSLGEMLLMMSMQKVEFCQYR